jgi:hypothetical protein
MNENNRLASVEAQLRWMKRLVAMVVIGFASLLAVAAAAPEKLVRLVADDLTILGKDGKPAIEANADGNVTAKKITLNGVDVGTELATKSTTRVAFGKSVAVAQASPAVPGLWSGKAETDGFLLVYTGGTGKTVELQIAVDGGLRGRTSPAGYTSLVSPVAAGEKWEVRAFQDGQGKQLIIAGDCTVSWLPIQSK